MGEFSKIEWTDHTFNPWIGCQEVSPACDNCYARVQNNHRKWVRGWGPHGERKRTAASTWKKVYALQNNYSWFYADNDRRQRLFCASLADVFDNKADPAWRADLWAMIANTPNLDWQLLTKRPQNIKDMLPTDWGSGYPNVWLGATVEGPDQIRRVWDLLTVPARIHFLSCEPLLGDIVKRMSDAWKPGDTPHIDWIICGGESAKGIHRPMDLTWARNLRDYCKDSGIAFFMKQIDKKQPIPDDLMIREFPGDTHAFRR